MVFAIFNLQERWYATVYWPGHISTGIIINKKCNYFSEILQNNKFLTFNYLFYKTFMICQLLIKSKVKVNKGFTAEQ